MCFFILPVCFALSQKNPLIQNNWNDRIEFNNLQNEDIPEFRKYLQQKIQKVINHYFITNNNPPTFFSTMYALDSIYDLIYCSPLGFLADVHPDESIRKICQQETLKIDSIEDAIKQNSIIYKRIIAFADSKEAKDLSAEKKKYLADQIKTFEKNGIHLTGAKKEEFQKVVSDINHLSQSFLINAQMKPDTFFTRKEKLKGLPDEFLQNRMTADGRYFIVVPGPDYNEVMTQADDAETRENIYYLRKNYAYKENQDILLKLTAARQGKAQLLGYKNYASYKYDDFMAEDPENVMRFQESLIKDISNLSKEEKKELAQVSGSGDINIWDVNYYKQDLTRKKFAVDEQELKSYFPLNKVINGMLKISGEMFDFTYDRIDDPKAWHPDVILFEVKNAESELIGYIYLDLLARSGKMSQGAYMTPIRFSKGRRIPQILLVCSFSKEKPSLLNTSEIQALFHEFGHLLHGLFFEKELVLQNGLFLPWDFVEGPSQFMELWPWQKEVLTEISGHYQSGNKIPDEMLHKMKQLNIRAQFSSTRYLLYLGILDRKLHTDYKEDETYFFSRVEKEIWEEIYPYPYPDKTQNTLTDLFILGYEPFASASYSYLWSDVYAKDMFSVFCQDGKFNKDVAKRYKNTILNPGCTKPAGQLLYDFLGRKPNPDAFTESMGL